MWPADGLQSGLASAVMVLLTCRRKVQVVLVSLLVSSILCLLVLYRRRSEKLTDYHFLRDDSR